MGVSSSTLKLVAPAAFVINVACQIYGMTSKPNMMDIHNKNISFFSPYVRPASYPKSNIAIDFCIALVYRCLLHAPAIYSARMAVQTMEARP